MGQSRVHVIASDRPWYVTLPPRLMNRTGQTFHLITDPTLLTIEYVEALSPRFVFFPHWSHRIPVDIHSRFECVIFHMADVPFGRGGSPLQNLVVRGVTATKMSALKCVEEMDAGPVYMKRDLSLEGSAAEVFARCVPLIEDMIVEIVQCEPEPTPQSGEPVVFARREPWQSDISGTTTLEEVYDAIRMLDADGYPPAFVETRNMRFELRDARIDQDSVVARVRIVRRETDDS